MVHESHGAGGDLDAFSITVTGYTSGQSVTFLLFERPFCRALIALGYKDAMQRRAQILEFLGAPVNDLAATEAAA